MMLKVGSEFIHLDEEPEMVRQAKTPNLLDQAGDFSYQFSLPNTNENRRILNLISFDNSEFNADADLVTDSGISLYTGVLAIESMDTEINCSFLSGNSDWFTTLKDKKVFEVPILYTVQWKTAQVRTTPNATLVASWANTEGIVFPLIDNGKLRNFSIQRLDSEDFLPMTYIRDLLGAIFKSNGFKYSGDLFTDGLFNTLVCGTGFYGGNFLPFFEGLSFFVGKTSQVINTVPSKILFTDTTFPYKVGSYGAYDPLTSTYTAPIAFRGIFSIDWNFSGSVIYTIELRKNGSAVYTLTGTGAEVSQIFGYDGGQFKNPTTTPSALTMALGDDVEVYASVLAGSTSVTGTFKMEVSQLSDYYPQFMVGAMSQGEFVKSVFTMFNVISTYDPITKNINCDLFENLSNKTPKDLSTNCKGYRFDFSEILSDLASSMVFKHQSSETPEVENYNTLSPTPWGAGAIEVTNRLVSGEKTTETQFTAPMDYFNNLTRSTLADLGIWTFTYDDEPIPILSVVADGFGIAVFTTDGDHGFQDLDFVLISGTSNGDYQGLGRVSTFGLALNEFKISHLAFTSTTTGNVARATRSISQDTDKVFLLSYYANMPVSEFSFKSTLNYAGTNYSNMAWGYFLKDNTGLPVDQLRKTPAFGKNENNTSITLLDNYYNLYQRSIRSPVKIYASLLLTEAEYLNLDFSHPVVLTTEQFTFRFYISKITGFKNSFTTCEAELIKI